MNVNKRLEIVDRFGEQCIRDRPFHFLLGQKPKILCSKNDRFL